MMAMLLAAVLITSDGDTKTFDVAIHESGASVENGITQPIYTVTVGDPEPSENVLMRDLLIYFLPTTENEDHWYGMTPLDLTTIVNPGTPDKVLPAPFNVLTSEDLKNGKVITLYRDGSMRFYFQEGKVTLDDLEKLLVKMNRVYNLRISRKLKTFF